MTDNLILLLTENGFDVLIKCRSSQKYTVHHFEHIVSKADNADLYRIRTSHGAELVGGEVCYLFNGDEMVGGGEWECAIKEVGTVDCIGGFHGDEILTSVRLEVDGRELELGKPERIVCREIRFTQCSVLNSCDRPEETVALHTKHYTVTADGIALEQWVEWSKAVQLECAYLCMLPIQRQAGGVSLFDRAMALDGKHRGKICDVSSERSKTVLSRLNRGTTRVKAWGDQSGAEVFVEHMTSPQLPRSAFFLRIRPWDNKCYFMNCKRHKTAVGERWHSHSLYCFDMR